MPNLLDTAPGRNSSASPSWREPPLTIGGRIIYRRTGWGASLCNLIAALAGIGGEGAAND